jgi:hypothetical protein
MHNHNNLADSDQFATPQSFEKALAMSDLFKVTLDIGRIGQHVRHCRRPRQRTALSRSSGPALNQSGIPSDNSSMHKDLAAAGAAFWEMNGIGTLAPLREDAVKRP